MAYRYLFNGLLIDGTGQAPVPDAAILIEGDRIAADGPRSTVRPPEGAAVESLDARGGTILPGFIDCHVHVTGEAFSSEDPHMTPHTYQVLNTAQYCRATLEAGVTTVRDAAGAARVCGAR